MEKPYKIDEQYIMQKKTYYIDQTLVEAISEQNINNIINWLSQRGYNLNNSDLNDLNNPITVMLGIIIQGVSALNNGAGSQPIFTSLLPYLPNMILVLGNLGTIEVIDQKLVLINGEPFKEDA